jgi:hypothetical protein
LRVDPGLPAVGFFIALARSSLALGQEAAMEFRAAKLLKTP